MNRQLRILVSGVAVVIPFAITVWVIWAVGAWLDGLVNRPLLRWDVHLYPGVGILIVIGAIYLVGLLMHFWAFRGLMNQLDRLFTRVPGVKTVYEALRDLTKLFGGQAGRMGSVVVYQPPESQTAYLGILTNPDPIGISQGSQDKRVAVYIPLSYMFGGPTIYVPPQHLRKIDMSVEQALKLATIAQVSSQITAQQLTDDRPRTGQEKREK